MQFVGEGVQAFGDPLLGRAGLVGKLRLCLRQQLFGLLTGFGGDLTGLFFHGAGDLGSGLLRGVSYLTGLLLRHVGGRGVVRADRSGGVRVLAVGRCLRP